MESVIPASQTTQVCSQWAQYYFFLTGQTGHDAGADVPDAPRLGKSSALCWYVWDHGASRTTKPLDEPTDWVLGEVSTGSAEGDFSLSLTSCSYDTQANTLFNAQSPCKQKPF